MSNETNIYLDHLWENGRTIIKNLSQDDLINMASKLIKEMPTKHLPPFEPFDKDREVVLMMSEWMQSEDDYLGLQILNKMRDLIIMSMTPEIQDKIDDYRQQEESMQRATKAHIKLENAIFDSQRDRG